MKNITAINLYETKKKKKQAHSDLLIYNLELPLANSIRVSHTIHVILLNGNPYPLSQKKSPDYTPSYLENNILITLSGV